MAAFFFRLRLASECGMCQLLLLPMYGGVLVSTECSMCWLHVEVDRLAS
jgi:hypothetical protein